jgi:peptide/nickel transport system permease protein
MKLSPFALSEAKESYKIQTISPGRQAWIAFIKNPSGLVGTILLSSILIFTIFGPVLYATDPFEISGMPFSSPGEELPLGSDYLGRDMLAGIMSGGRASLAVGMVSALLTVVIGIFVGSFSGFFGGRIDMALMKVTEFFQVLPTLLFVMVLVTVFSPSIVTITLAIGVSNWMAVARLTRAEFLRLKGRDYVKSVIAAGAGSGHLMLKTILPNALSPIIVEAAFDISWAILLEGSLSFLGLGDPNRMSWGLIIGQNKNYVLDAWWTVVMPGSAIFLAVLSICLIGDGLNDALNPQLRRR